MPTRPRSSPPHTSGPSRCTRPASRRWTTAGPCRSPSTCDRCWPRTTGRERVMSDWHGGSFGERARCLLAPNPGMMTLDGTNTWVLREPGASKAVVIDPGPVAEGHLDLLDEQL